jgi:hypothetical protein
VVDVDRFRTSMGGWVRLLFKNVNGSPLSKVELAHVSNAMQCSPKKQTQTAFKSRWSDECLPIWRTTGASYG